MLQRTKITHEKKINSLFLVLKITKPLEVNIYLTTFLQHIKSRKKSVTTAVQSLASPHYRLYYTHEEIQGSIYSHSDITLRGRYIPNQKRFQSQFGNHIFIPTQIKIDIQYLAMNSAVCPQGKSNIRVSQEQRSGYSAG